VHFVANPDLYEFAIVYSQGKSNDVVLERFDIILPESAFFGKQNLKGGDSLFRVDRVYFSW